MLCLQNPNGPMSVQECQQDVQAFFTEMALAYYGHNVSIPICTPSMKNGSFFTIGSVQKFTKISNRFGNDTYQWVGTGQLSVSTYINNKPWRQWGFSGSDGKLTSVGSLTDMSKSSNTFLRVIPISAEGMEKGGPYASVLPKGYSLNQHVSNDDLLNKYASKYAGQSSSGFSQYPNTKSTSRFPQYQNTEKISEEEKYVRAWIQSTGYKLK